MIIIDKLGHLSSTENLHELLTFGKKIGLKECWIHNSKGRIHFDITTKRMYSKAVEAGAKEVPSKDVIKKSWWSSKNDKLE